MPDKLIWAENFVNKLLVLLAMSLLRLNQILFAQCLSYHSSTEAVLLAWATTTGTLLGPKMVNNIKCVSQGHSDTLPRHASISGVEPRFRILSIIARRCINWAMPPLWLVSLELIWCSFCCEILIKFLSRPVAWNDRI